MYLWLSSRKMTVSADVNKDGVILDAAPIVRKFVGQHLMRLAVWMHKQGGFCWSILDSLVIERRAKR